MRSHARWLTALILCALGAPAALSAQWPADVAPGARVRARLPELQYQSDDRRGLLIRGRVLALTPDTLYLAVTDSVGSLPIPRRLIERLDVSRGVPSRGTSALTRGLYHAAYLGLSLGVIYGLDNDDDVSTGTAILVGAGSGFTLGAIVGAIFPRERWKSTRLETP